MNRILLNLPETVETSRLKLQMPKAGLGEGLHQAMMDGYDDYIKWLDWSAEPPTAESVEEECRKNHAKFILRESIRYIIIDKNTSIVIGEIIFPVLQADWRTLQFGIGYFIRKSHRSKGYAVEAAHAMTLIAFKILKAKKVAIHCDAENISSSKIPLKLNFQLEYTQRDGKLAQLQTYSIFSMKDLPDMEINLIL